MLKKEDPPANDAKDTDAAEPMSKLKIKDPRAVMASAATARGEGEDAAPAIEPAVVASESGVHDHNHDDDLSKSTTNKVHSTLPPGHARPVIIHRAMAGSIERFMGEYSPRTVHDLDHANNNTGILCEHFAGKWPFWLSPRQVMVIPVGKGFYEYAERVRRVLHSREIYVDVDVSGNTLLKKIALAQGETGRYNFTFVVGAEEMQNGTVNVRFRDDQSTQSRGTPVALDEAVDKLVRLRADRGTYNPFAVSA